MRLAVRVGGVLLGLLLTYEAVTFVQVWWTARHDEARPAQAIVVFGAAQYAGRPSPVLRARLDHAADLWDRELAKFVVVTGGKQPADTTTEATASANYLMHEKGVPDEAILREVAGTNSWDSLAAAAAFLRKRGISKVLLVSDPFHSLRIKEMAGELHLNAHVSPTRTSPIGGFEELTHLGRETIAVSVGRVIGFRRLMRVERVRAPARAS
jgi:uncharacterized SAM-binding protein YcdF (DUF218 family)